MKSKAYAPNVTDELQLLYTALISDIQFYKSQQWSVTNYTVLIYAALIGISQILEPYRIYSLNILLVLVGFLVMVVGIKLICQLDKDYKASRSVKKKVMKKFSCTFKDYIKMIDKNWDSEESEEKNLSTQFINLLLKGVIIVGAFVVYLIISLMTIPYPLYFRPFHH